LEVEAEVSAIADITTGTLTVQRATTTVEMPSGGSLVVGGLLQHTLTTDIRGTPGLKDVPVFGPLFRENELGRTDTELVFAVTAYLVKPVAANKLKDPTGLVAPPTDYELYFLGHLEAIYGDKEAGEEVAATVLKGPIGYIVQ
jgi:pilus assembly protein CpaC